MYIFNNYTFIYLMSAIISIVVMFVVSYKKDFTGMRFFVLFEIAVNFWILTGIFEMASASVFLKEFWSAVTYIGISMCTYFFFYFSLSFSSHPSLVKNVKLKILLLIIPLMAIIMVFTNPLHHLWWVETTIDPGTNIAFYKHGTIFWLFLIYSYLLLAVSSAIFFRSVSRYPGFYIPQIVMMAVSVFLPLVGNAMYAFNINPVPGLDWTPIAFAFCGILILINKSLFGLFSGVPIAYKKILHLISEGIILTDKRGRIVEVNDAAKLILGSSCGKDDLLCIDNLISRLGCGKFNNETEIAQKIYLPFVKKHIELNVLVLREKEEVVGTLYMIRDITDWLIYENQLKELAYTDSLTGLNNRRHFYELALYEIKRAARYSPVLSMVMIDIDNFKLINDTFGHDAGDTVIRDIADMLKLHLRKTDVYGRVGGEEFAVIFPETSPDVAFRLIEDIRLRISPVDIGGGNIITYTISSGVTGYKSGEDIDAFVKRSDIGLYRAKNSGKNKTVINLSED